MPGYEVPRSIIEASLAEMAAISRWINDRENRDDPVTVLIGGWAVYCYNPWYGSIDIDLVTNAKTRKHLMQHLLSAHGFIRRRNPPFKTNVVKNILPDGEIIIDFIPSDERNYFEGSDATCPMSLLKGRTVPREITPGFFVTIPERSLLLLLKLKAAWDRAYRIKENTSKREDWEKGKLRKDRADILSLIDPRAGGTDLDLMFLGEKIRNYRFLTGTFTTIPDDLDAIQMYGRMDREAARNAIANVMKLIE